MLYKQIERNPQESQQHRDAAKKVREFSVMLHSKIQATANRPQVNPNQPRPQSDANAPAQTPQPQPQTQPSTMPPAPRPIPEAMRHHVNTFPFVAPANFAPGSNEAAQFIQQLRDKYTKGLIAMETAAHGLKRIDAQVAARNQEGKPLTPDEQKEIQGRKVNVHRTHADAKRFIETFRAQQQEAAAAQNQQAGGGPPQNQQAQPSQPQPQPQQPQQQQQQQPQQAPQQGPSPVPGPTRPTMNLQQSTAQNQAMQQTEAVQAAMQAARNQQINGGRPSVANPNVQAAQHPNEQGQPQPQNQGVAAGQMPNMPPGQGAQPNLKIETGPSQPLMNTPLATAPPHIQQMQARQAATPQTAPPQPAMPPSATSVGPPKPLSQHAAMAQAARTYSSSQTAGTPSVMASHAHPSLPRDAPNIKSNLMPIPKQLPPGAIGTPHPVPMPPARPTYTGGASGSGSGPMQQPPVTKPPGFTIEGDAERVLNKRKLDELVRQVTGGGEGLDNTESLTPEVEDVSSTFLHFISNITNNRSASSPSPTSSSTKSSPPPASAPRRAAPRRSKSATSSSSSSATTTSASPATHPTRSGRCASSSRPRAGSRR